MTKSLIRFVLIMKFLGMPGILGCGTFSPTSFPQQYSIRLDVDGGMNWHHTTIFLSNSEDSYVYFNTEGVENTIPIHPSVAELDALVKYVQKEKIHRIKSNEVEALDRGGDKIVANFDGKRIEASNMGFSFIKKNWVKEYIGIRDSIYALTQKHLDKQLHTIIIELDSSMIKDNWHTGFQINDGAFIGRSNYSKAEDFQTSLSVPVIIGENKLSLYIVDNPPVGTQRTSILNWNEAIRFSSEIKKMIFSLVDGELVIRYES